MKGSNILIGLGIAAAAIYLLGRNATAQESGTVGEIYPGITQSLQASGETSPNAPAFRSALTTFSNATINTPESVKAGVNLINTAWQTNTPLPRLSATLGYTDQGRIARLADGSIKEVIIRQPARDQQGKTALDRLIEKNKAARV